MKDGDKLDAGKGVIIREVLRQINEKNLPSTSIRLEWLKDCPEVIPVIAEWQYNDWSGYDTSLTREKLINGFKSQLGANDVPFTLIALKYGMPIGSISLEIESEPELSDLPGPWGGSFHVISAERKKGVARELANALLTITEKLGYSHLYIFTSNFANVDMYVNQGAEIIDTRPYKGHAITVLRMVDLRVKPPAFVHQ